MGKMKWKINKEVGINDKSKQNSWMLVIYSVALLLAIVVGFQKINFHVDEIFSYGLANSVDNVTLNPHPLEKLENADDVFKDYITVPSGGRFEYSYVWDNQTRDVHPPFYYALLHTICSFFPENFSMWYAYSLNIFFFLLTIFIAYKITVRLTGNSSNAIAVSAFLAVSPAMLEANTFLRMYTMAMFLASLFTYLLLGGIERECGWRFYLAIGITAVCSAMTHYYILIYIFFLSAYYVVMMFTRKKIKNIILFAGSMALSGCLSYLIFPAMLKHVFAGQRGQESFENLVRKGDYGERLITFLNMMANRIFGGYMVIVIVAIIGIMVYTINKRMAASVTSEIKGKGKMKENHLFHRILMSAGKLLNAGFGMILFAVIAYLLLVSKIAPYLVARYIYVIYPLVFILLVELVYKHFKVFSVQRYKLIPVYICLLLLLAGEYLHCPWEYFFKDSEEALRISEEYKDKECIYIYRNESSIWRAQSSYYELKNYSSLMFVPLDRLGELENAALLEEQQVVVYIQNILDQEETLQKLSELLPGFNGWNSLYQYASNSVYLME